MEFGEEIEQWLVLAHPLTYWISDTLHHSESERLKSQLGSKSRRNLALFTPVKLCGGVGEMSESCFKLSLGPCLV